MFHPAGQILVLKHVVMLHGLRVNAWINEVLESQIKTHLVCKLSIDGRREVGLT